MGILKAVTILSYATAALAIVPEIPGFRITWSDDFVGLPGQLPDLSKWIIDTGTQYPGGPPNWGTGEIQTYTRSNLNIALNGNSELTITPRRGTSGAWTSARIESVRTDFYAKPGGKMRIRARIRAPGVTGAAAAGYWAAAWMLGAKYRGNYQSWPLPGEVDIMEVLNGQNRAFGVVHCDKKLGGVCREPDGLGASRVCPTNSCTGNFHTYAIEVDRSVVPEVCKWFIDGIEYHRVNQNQLGKTVWAQVFHGGQFMLLNLAIGGGFPTALYGSRTPTAQTVPGYAMTVDYVAVYNSI